MSQIGLLVLKTEMAQASPLRPLYWKRELLRSFVVPCDNPYRLKADRGGSLARRACSCKIYNDMGGRKEYDSAGCQVVETQKTHLFFQMKK